MKKIQGKVRFIFVAILVIAVITIGIYIYNVNLSTDLAQITCNTLEEIMQQQGYNFTSKLQSEKDTVKVFADLVSQSLDSKEDVLKSLNHIVKDTHFEYADFTTLDGVTMTNEGEYVDISDREYFLSASAGETVISEPIESKIRNAKIIAIASPVRKDGQIIGVLSVTYESQKLDELFLSSFGGNGYAYIITNTGQIIARTKSEYTITQSDSVFDTYEKANFYENDSFETMRKNLCQNKSGHSKYEYDGEKRFAHYSTININDWNIISIVPEASVIETVNKISNNSTILTVSFCTLFAFLILYIYKAQKIYVEQLTKMAFVDELTGGMNLNKFKIIAKDILYNNKVKKYILVRIDINNFKIINDMYGFDEGDKVLCDICDTLKLLLHDGEIFARISNDDFIILETYEGDHTIVAKVKHFEETFSRLNKISQKNYKISFSTGVYKILDNETDIVTMIERATMSHKAAKKTGGGNVVFYDEEIRNTAIKDKTIENTMQEALKNGDFVVYLQPKFNLKTGEMIGAEALIRWMTSPNTIVPPGDFIPTFEKNGFIVKIDMFVLEEVCKMQRRWIDEGLTPVPISVNQSKLLISDSNYIDLIYDVVKKFNIPTYLIELELLETVIHDNIELLKSAIVKLHELGFLISIDDFGSGYSSLNMLKDINADIVKIDRGFLNKSEDNGRGEIVLSNVIRLAKELKMSVVTEGVETEKQAELLLGLDCDIVQGFMYAKPMPVGEFEKRL